MGLFFLLLALPLLAQTSMARFYAVGGTFQTYSHPELTGWASMALPIDSKKQNWSYSTYDVTPIKGKLLELQTSVRTGFATQIKTIGPILIFALVDGGYASTGQEAGGAVSGGFVGVLPLGKNKIWNILGSYQISKTQVNSGSPKVYRLGFGRSF